MSVNTLRSFLILFLSPMLVFARNSGVLRSLTVAGEMYLEQSFDILESKMCVCVLREEDNYSK